MYILLLWLNKITALKANVLYMRAKRKSLFATEIETEFVQQVGVLSVTNEYLFKSK